VSACENCQRYPDWRIDRVGDAVVDGACNAHLADVVRRLQRAWEITELHVRPERRAVRVFQRSDGSWRSKCFICRPPVWPDLEPTSWAEAQASAVLHAQIYHPAERSVARPA
jgi:hypothetical protein